MKIRWTREAVADLERLREFLEPVNPRAAHAAWRRLVDAPVKLIQHPRLGERLPAFDPREVRRLVVGHYEVRYEIAGSELFVIRLFHAREDR